jgi:homoserine O-acetyltransferase
MNIAERLVQQSRTYQKGTYTFDSLNLQKGENLSPITIAYSTWGKLNEAKSNAILVASTLTSDTFVHDEENPGYSWEAWWNFIVGPGRPLDTTRFFIICPNSLGGCYGSTGPSSINPATQQPYGMDFPLVTVRDIVETQRRLIEHLGIQHLEMVIGGSFGGQQALEWAVAYPDLMKKVVVIEATATMATLGLIWGEIGRQIIKIDPRWRHGSYYTSDEKPLGGLALARMLALTTYFSEELLDERFGRKITLNSLIPSPSETEDMGERFTVENFLYHMGGTFASYFDPNSYLYLSHASNHYDVSESYTSLEEALKRIKSQILFVASSSDMLFPAAHVRRLAEKVQACGGDAYYWELQSSHGHDAFLREEKQMLEALWSFM